MLNFFKKKNRSCSQTLAFLKCPKTCIFLLYFCFLTLLYWYNNIFFPFFCSLSLSIRLEIVIIYAWFSAFGVFDWFSGFGFVDDGLVWKWVEVEPRGRHGKTTRIRNLFIYLFFFGNKKGPTCDRLAFYRPTRLIRNPTHILIFFS